MNALFLFMAIFARAAVSDNEPFDPAKHPEYQIEPGNPTKYNLQVPPEAAPNSDLGYQMRPNGKIHQILRTKDSIIFDVTMNYDSNGNRITPQDHPERRDRFLVFSDGSFINGTGVRDNETLPFYVAQEVKTHHVYNFGIGGYGPNMMLAQIQEPELESVLREKQGVFVYVTMYPHIGTANVFYEESDWMFGTPAYDYGSDGKLQRNGSFATAHPWRLGIYHWLKRLQARWFPSFDFNWPPLSSRHFKYVCDLVTTAATDFQRKYPTSKFIVLNHPLHSMQPEVLQCMKDHGLTVLEPNIPRREEYTFKYEAHPTARFNRDFSKIVATELAPYLK